MIIWDDETLASMPGRDGAVHADPARHAAHARLGHGDDAAAERQPRQLRPVAVGAALLVFLLLVRRRRRPDAAVAVDATDHGQRRVRRRAASSSSPAAATTAAPPWRQQQRLLPRRSQLRPRGNHRRH